LYGADGREYIDYVGSWGPAILGHAQPDVVQAVQARAESGLGFGAPTALEVEFAEAILARYTSMQMMRCVSSGPEATMSDLLAAPSRSRSRCAPRVATLRLTSSSSSTAATTFTPTVCWSRRAAVWPRSAIPTRQACRPAWWRAPRACPSTTARRWPSCSSAKR